MHYITIAPVNSGYWPGFQGQEMDNEIAGTGNSYTAQFWQYDSRLGRRWNVDPVVKEHESPYACFANSPIYIIDPNGADTSLTQKSRELIKNLTDPNHDDYNEKFTKDFQRLVDDKSIVYTFDQWDVTKDLGNKTKYDEFTVHGKNKDGQNLVTISYSLEGSTQSAKL